jgi:hypothetical protein
MGYLQALKLMVRAYKAAKGVMPKGLDLLKLKMRARQKAIDSKKIIQFPKDRITDPFKPRPQGIEKLIKKGDVKIGQAPKTTKVKEPVDPKLIMQESEKQTLARMRKENKEAIKKFKEKMDKPRDGKAIGGYVTRNVTPQPRDPKLQNLLDVYESNPTLQSQMTADEYLMQTYRPSPSEPQTYAEMTQQQPTAGIPAIKPIVPIIPPQGDGDDSGGGITAPTGYGYRGPSMTIEDIEEGTITPEEESFAQGQALRSLAEKTLVGNLFFKAKDFASDKAKEIADKVRAEEIAKAEALKSLQQAIARNQARASQQDWSGASSDYSGGYDASTGNYDDPYSPGDTE